MVQPIPAIPNSIPESIAAANTASDGSGALVQFFTAGKEGSRVDAVVFRNEQAVQAASSDMLAKVFVTDTAGTNPKLIGEIAIPATTRNATTLGAKGVIIFTPALTLLQGQVLKACISVYAGVQDKTSVIAFGGDYQ